MQQSAFWQDLKLHDQEAPYDVRLRTTDVCARDRNLFFRPGPSMLSSHIAHCSCMTCMDQLLKPLSCNPGKKAKEEQEPVEAGEGEQGKDEGWEGGLTKADLKQEVLKILEGANMDEFNLKSLMKQLGRAGSSRTCS